MINKKNSSSVAIVSVIIWLLSLSLSWNAFGAGEYDGVWVGSQDVWVPGFLSTTETTGTVIYQQNQDTLNLWDPLFGSVNVVRSGGQWVMPAPISTTYLGQPVTLSAFVISSLTTTHLTGTITVRIQDTDGTATLDHYRQTCPALVKGTTVSGITGQRDEVLCYELNLPPGSTDLVVETGEGSGNCDLLVVYHRPNFDNALSENDWTVEQVTFAAPNSGKWYVGLLGAKGFLDVNLVANYTGLPASIADFSADPVGGQSPLTVRFTNRSTGSISSWQWDFGDGARSTAQSPQHTYGTPGTYTVSLTVDGPGGLDTETKSGLIEVTVPPKKTRVLSWLQLLLPEKK